MNLQRTPPTIASDDNLSAAIASLTGVINGMNNELKELRSDFNNKFDNLSQQMTNQFAVWDKEKAELVNNQIELENKIDQLERNQKRPNIIVTGFDPEIKSSVRDSIEQLFREKVAPGIVVATAYKVNMKNGASKFIATMRSVEDKIMVMKNKSKLQRDDGKKVFVADDLIKKDDFIQFQARLFAKKMRMENKEAKVAFKRVYVNNVAHVWDENTQNFVNRKN